MGPLWGLFGASLGPLWGLFGASWGHGCKEASWRPLGALPGAAGVLVPTCSSLSTYVAVVSQPRIMGARSEAPGRGGQVLCAGVVLFAHAGVKVSVSSRRNAHFRFRALTLPCRGSSCRIWLLSFVFKNDEHARTICSTSSRASGWRAGTRHVQKSPRLSAKVGLRAQTPNVV